VYRQMHGPVMQQANRFLSGYPQLWSHVYCVGALLKMC